MASEDLPAARDLDPRAGTPPVLSRRRRFGVLAICSLSLFIVGLDTTIVNVALPSIQHELHADLSGLQWVIDAYLLVLASLLMLSGSMGDRLGRRRVFQTGLVLFTAGSAACSLAPNVGTLVAFRMLQAVGGSMLNPNSLSIVSNVFTDGRERAQAIGIWGGVFGVSAASGPILGGLLVDSIGWRTVFWVNVPIGIAAFVLAARFVPESRAPRARRVDWPGQALTIVVLASATYAIIEGPSDGWSSPTILGLFAFALAALATFVVVERRRTDPLVDLRFFRSAPFSGATAVAVLVFFVLAGFLFLNTLYLQEVRGDSALVAGLSTLPMTAVLAVTAPLSGRIIGRRGARIPLVGAGALVAAGAAILTRVTPELPYGVLAVAYVLLGLGLGLVNPAITNTAVAGMPRSQAGVASGIAAASRQVGSALGVAAIGSIATTRFRAELAARATALGLSAATRQALAHAQLGSGGLGGRAGSAGGALGGLLRDAFTAGSHDAWWMACACGLGVLVLGWTTTGHRGRASAERAAELLGADPPVGRGPEVGTGPAPSATHQREGGIPPASSRPDRMPTEAVGPAEPALVRRGPAAVHAGGRARRRRRARDHFDACWLCLASLPSSSWH